MKPKELLCRAVVGLAAALIIAAIGTVAYIVIDLALHPTDMPLMYIGVPPLTSLAAGALLAWYWVFMRVRAAGDERPAALGWGAGAALLAPALSVGIFSLLSTLVASGSASRMFTQWLCWLPIAGVSAVLAAWLVLLVRGRRAKHP